MVAHAAPNRRVQSAQVASLYATSWSSTLAGFMLIAALSGLFYWRLRDPMVLVWLGINVLQLLRYPATSAYHRDPQAPRRSAFWARRHCRELLIYSSLWGLAPWLFMPADDLPMTALLMLSILGMASGGVASVAPRWASVLSFVVPMLVGLISAMLWRGDTVHLFLAGCCVVYLGATLHFARQQHRLLNDALLMRFEKEALAEQLAQQVAVVERTSAEKTRFFAAASHDLRQPVHAIALFGAVLDKELQGRPEHIHAQRLMHAVHALGTSLDTLLDISRLDAGVVMPDIQATPLNPVFQTINHLFTSRAEEKGLQLRLRASPLAVRTDPALLTSMLSNLVENAIKYTPHGGVLVVARQRADHVWIDVCDTGTGIASEHLEYIFEEFYQGNNPGRDRSQGLGIGLSIVRRLSVLLKHPVQVYSRPGRGSRFRVLVPAIRVRKTRPAPPLLAQRDAHPSPADIDPAALPQHMLLIDDEPAIGQGLAALLGAYGVQLEVAEDEAQAITAFEQSAAQNKPFDTLLCDYRLADGANGLQAALRLRARFNPKLPLMLITGETAPERLQSVYESGVPVLFKPVAAKVLLEALARLLK